MKKVRSTRGRGLIAILWPSFLVAGLSSGILFAFVDPWTLMDEAGIDAGSRLSGYSIVFLFLWLGGIVTAFFALYIFRTPEPGANQDHPREEPRL